MGNVKKNCFQLCREALDRGHDIVTQNIMIVPSLEEGETSAAVPLGGGLYHFTSRTDHFVIQGFQTMPVDSAKMMTYNRIMISLNINEIKTHFSTLIASVSKGETLIVCKGNVPMAKITPISALPDKRRPIGLAAKEYPDFEIDDAFFDPLPDDILAAFNGEGP